MGYWSFSALVPRGQSSEPTHQGILINITIEDNMVNFATFPGHSTPAVSNRYCYPLVLMARYYPE